MSVPHTFQYLAPDLRSRKVVHWLEPTFKYKPAVENQKIKCNEPMESEKQIFLDR
jgi:hypothetical protein